MSDRITITAFRSVTDSSAGKPMVLAWSALVENLTTSFKRAAQKREVAGWAPATFEPVCSCGDEKCPGDRGHRLDENAVKVYALVLDLDKKSDGTPLDQAGADVALARLAELGLKRIVHTTHSHAPPAHVSLRVVIALSRPVIASVWEAFWESAIAHVAIHVEPSCCNPARFWYAPSCPPDAEPWGQAFDGKPLDVDALFATTGTRREPVQTPRSNGASYVPREDAFDLSTFIAERYVGAEEYTSRGRRCWDIECPWEHEHTPGSGGKHDTVVSLAADGELGFSCRHDHCRDARHWREFRKFHQPDWIPFDERPTNGHNVSHREPPIELDESTLALASHDDEAPPPAAPTFELSLLRELAPKILEQSTVPRMDYGFPGLNEKMPLPLRCVNALVGPTGAGKTSLAMTIGAHHARFADTPKPSQGPTVHILYELTREQIASKRVSQRAPFSWSHVLGGALTVAEMDEWLAGEWYFVIKAPRGADYIGLAQRALDAAQKRVAGTPLLIVDYLQRIKGKGGDLRQVTANVFDDFVDLTESRDMFTLMLAKGSRGGSMRMRGGKEKGEALIDTAAETSAIETGATVQMNITYENREGADGPLDAKLVATKNRYGVTGVTIGVRFDGLHGAWNELDFVPLTAAEKDAGERVHAAARARGEGFASANALSSAATGNNAANLAAIKRGLRIGGPLERREDGRIYPRVGVP